MTTTEAPDGRYRIAELARLSGFSPSTLRYYENAGVLSSPPRTAVGYRLYGDRDVERLRLIARAVERLRLIERAKELGYTLEEIAGLVEAWDADDCAPVKHQLRALVASKVAEVHRHVSEQIAFAAELEATAAALVGRPVDGPCDEHCGCTNRFDSATADSCAPDCGRETVAAMEPVTFVARRMDDTAVPVACSLSGGDMQRRLDEWRAVLTDVTHRELIAGGVRLAFTPAVPLREIVRLAAAEQHRCRFFAFALTIDDRGVALEVRAPADGHVLLEDVFGVSA